MQDVSAASPTSRDDDAELMGRENATHLMIEGADSYTYAAWQNTVPLLRSVTMDNSAGSELSLLVVELNASQGFAPNQR